MWADLQFLKLVKDKKKKFDLLSHYFQNMTQLIKYQIANHIQCMIISILKEKTFSFYLASGQLP